MGKSLKSNISETTTFITSPNEETKPSVKDSITFDLPESESCLSKGNLQVHESCVDVSNDKDVPKESGRKESCTSIKQQGWRRYIGIMFAFTASIIFALATLIVKLLTNYDALTVAVWRFQGIFWPSLVTLLYCRFSLKHEIFNAITPIRDPEKSKMLALLVCRAIVGCGAVIFQFYSLSYIEMADSSVIAFSTPICVVFVAHFCLKEKCGVVPIICAVLTLCGVLVITRPPIITGKKEFDRNTLIGAGFAFCSMMCSTMVFVLLRKIRAIHYAVITTFFGFWSSVECLILTTFIHPFEFPRNLNDWLLAAALAILTFVAHGSITLALRFEQSGPVSLIRTCDVIFAFIWQAVFLSVIADIYSFIGASIVITGVLISGVRKWIGELPEDHYARIKYSFLLA